MFGLIIVLNAHGSDYNDKKNCKDSGVKDNSPEYWKCINKKFKLQEEYKPEQLYHNQDFFKQEQQRMIDDAARQNQKIILRQNQQNGRFR